MFEPIECLVELVDMVGMMWILKTRWLIHIHGFKEGAIEECTFHINLKQLEIMVSNKGK